MKRLRSYSRMAKQSPAVIEGAEAFARVYAEVDARSEGRCEVTWISKAVSFRCIRRGAEHHHLFKPRRAHHTALEVVHVCRDCHDRTDWPFKRGRLCFLGRVAIGVREEFRFTLRYASDKFAARGDG